MLKWLRDDGGCNSLIVAGLDVVWLVKGLLEHNSIGDMRQSIGWQWSSSEGIDAGSTEGVPRLKVGLREIEIKCIVKICVVGSDKDPTARRQGTHHIKFVGPMAAYLLPVDARKGLIPDAALSAVMEVLVLIRISYYDYIYVRAEDHTKHV